MICTGKVVPKPLRDVTSLAYSGWLAFMRIFLSVGYCKHVAEASLIYD